MLHYVHQLSPNCVCLLYDAEQIVNSGFLELFHTKKKMLHAASKNDTMTSVSEPEELWARQLNNELNLAVKLLKSWAELQVQMMTPFAEIIVILYVVIIKISTIAT